MFGFHVNVLHGSVFGETESSHASDYAGANRSYEICPNCDTRQAQQKLTLFICKNQRVGTISASVIVRTEELPFLRLRWR